jgi:branched-chain amino acid transport system ATP-binding protein
MTETNPPLLIVQHLSLAFGGVTAIDNLSFVARDRQITALVGRQGAGKTCVLNCITGYYRPSSGRMEFHSGERPFLLERMEHCRIAREAQIVRSFGNPRFFRRMSVLETVLLAQDALRSRTALLCGSFGLTRNRAGAERARYWLDKMGLQHLAGEMAADLSPLLRRRLEMVCALACGARLICMDQPENGLDERERDRLLRQLLDAKTGGPAMLITAEDLRFAGPLSDHVVVLDRGACIAAGSFHEVCGDAAVLRTWLGVAPGGETVPRVALSC